MHILLIGSGGREHALAWKIAQSPHLTQLYTLPGNSGTAQYGINLQGDSMDKKSILEIAKEYQIDLVFIGPEAPLAAGLADALEAEGFPVFGPDQAGAQIEASKAFSKAFMVRHSIPTANFKVFDQLEYAVAYLDSLSNPFVIKASGLAAGKGVYLPDTIYEGKAILEEIMTDRIFGDAGAEVVIEEYLSGPEISVMGFTDGEVLVLMPSAQDHKRLQDGDLGPNTGGMGVFAPSPTAAPEVLEEARQKIMQPAIDGLRSEGIRYKGVLYGGLILTEDGLKALEFNCRFGDPETQVVLPLLKSDLVEIALACVRGELADLADQITWKNESAACVVLASEGYPHSYPKGLPITGLNSVDDSIMIFHAGTVEKDGSILTNGGRVLGITATADSLPAAVDKAYQAVRRIHFEGMQYRSDIGRKIPAYAAAGVSIETANQAMERIKQAVTATHTANVLSGMGSFGGLFDIFFIKDMDNPVLVGSTDGVGTKVILAEQYDLLSYIGHDIVNHCVNDILVQGARPLFFLDYFASSQLNADKLAEIVTGISEACILVGCALLGGETAEMPGVYAPDQFDLAGTIVGVVERKKMLPKTTIIAGDLLVGFLSSGPHTNGYSLIRKVFEDMPLETFFPEYDLSLGEALLAPHRSYFDMLWPLLNADRSPIKALVHITGGGFFDNIPRVLPYGLGAKIERGSWPVLPVFKVIQEIGQIDVVEMYHVFNMGVGMVAVIDPEDLTSVQEKITEKIWVIGEVTSGEGVALV